MFPGKAQIFPTGLSAVSLNLRMNAISLLFDDISAEKRSLSACEHFIVGLDSLIEQKK